MSNDHDHATELPEAEAEISPLMLGTTSGSSRFNRSLLMQSMRKALATGKPVTVFDTKGSYTHVSRRQAKKRLVASGLTSSAAGKLLSALTGLFHSVTLKEAMLHHKRHAERWFPIDIVVSSGRQVRRRKRK